MFGDDGGSSHDIASSMMKAARCEGIVVCVDADGMAEKACTSLPVDSPS